MKLRSRFSVEARVVAEDGMDRFRAETEARVSLDTEDGRRVLRISGKSLWARLRLTDCEARRLMGLLEKSLEAREDDGCGEQVVYFPRKKAVPK